MFGKWFKRKSLPQNDGNSESGNSERLHYVKHFDLELSNMEDTPLYALTHQLTIGSEIGNIVISDPSISPRHASFFLQDEVVSLLDHGSVSGTFVNGKRIDSGKKVILEDTDIIKVGELEVRLKVHQREGKPLEIPEFNEENESAVVIEQKKEAPKVTPIAQKKNNNKKKKPLVAISGTLYSANAVIRVLAVVSDILLSYAILIIFLPFDEFRNFLDFVPAVVADSLDINWNALFSVIGEDLSFLRDMVGDVIAFITSTFNIVPLFLVFILNRLISTILFGVSFSEFILGMRPDGNLIWARFGGILRVIVGIFTGPFLVFDLPAIVSRRTFKEFLTFTTTYVPSKLFASIGVAFYLPSLIVLTMAAPLFQGLELSEPIFVNDKIEQRVKVKAPQEGTAVLPASTPVTARSSSLNLEMSYDPQELLIVPGLKFQGVKKQLNVKNSLIFFQRDLQRPVTFELFKTFDFKQLLGFGMKENFFLYEKYPEIYNFVYEPAEVNIAFRKVQDANGQAKFANEVMAFTKSSLGLSTLNAFEFMQTETPLMKGMVDFKSSFLSLIEYKDFDQIGFIKIGNVIFMKVSYQMQKPFDLIIPLVKGQGRIFKVTFDKKENAGQIASKFYKFSLDKTNWFPEGKPEGNETYSALEVYDIFSGQNFLNLLNSPSKAQALYGYYFEASAEILKKGVATELDLWRANLANTLKFLEKLPEPPLKEGEDNLKMKLLQNFKDTIDALENRNTQYFGISQTTIL